MTNWSLFVAGLARAVSIAAMVLALLSSALAQESGAGAPPAAATTQPATTSAADKPASPETAAPAASAAAREPPAEAWITVGDWQFYNTSFRGLVILFVLAILIESALAVIFNWRLFLQLFYGRGVKTLVMIVVSALVVWAFNVDVIDTMMAAYGVKPEGGGQGAVAFWLTALILAGGSAGVYRILVALGYRQPKTAEEAVEKPAKGKAWIAVRTERKAAVGPIAVKIKEIGEATDASPLPLAGMIGNGGFWRRVAAVFVLARPRFPPAGGYAGRPGKENRIEVTAKNAAGEEIGAGLNGTYTFADGAIIDFVTTL